MQFDKFCDITTQIIPCQIEFSFENTLLELDLRKVIS